MVVGTGRLVKMVLCVQLIFCAQLAFAQKVGIPDSLSKGTVLFHFFQDDPEAAIRAALYAERSINKPRDGIDQPVSYKFALMRAGLALDMGNELQASRILNELSPEQLSAIDKARWHFQLARNAYRRRDWASLEREISSIPSDSKLWGSTRLMFLQAELCSLRGEFDKSAQYVASIDPKNVLHRYAGFNLGLNAYKKGHVNIAEAQLTELVQSKVYSREQLMLADRAKLVVAKIYLESGDVSGALTLLRSVTATEEYGPEAIAYIISLALEQNDYKRAADYARYLIETVPWHPAVRDAHVGLPYALEQIHGSERALGHYQLSIQRLSGRVSELNDLLASLDSGAAAALVSPDESSEARIAELGDMDWASWISSSESQALARGWKSLNGYMAVLKKHRRDLAGLTQIDVEQKRRSTIAANMLIEQEYQQQILKLQSAADNIIKSIDALTETPAAGGTRSLDALQLATQSEYRELQYLSAIKRRAARAGANSNVLNRIERLEGLFFYRIQNDLPLRVHKHRTQTETLLASLNELKGTSQRIRLASENIEIHDYFSNRIAAMDMQLNELINRSETTLEETGEALIAVVADGVKKELVGLDEQLVYLQLAIARIGDEKNVLAGGGD